MLIHIGMGHYVERDKVVAVVRPDSNPIRRLVQAAQDQGRLITATYGRRTRSVLIMGNGMVVLSMLEPESVASRYNGQV